VQLIQFSKVLRSYPSPHNPSNTLGRQAAEYLGDSQQIAKYFNTYLFFAIKRHFNPDMKTWLGFGFIRL
jgi:hypothetical protein